MAVLAPEKTDLAHPDSKTIQKLFNAISPKYDFLNSFLSLGLHHAWRRHAVRRSLTGLERSILDLGVGTGRSLRAFTSSHPFERAVGCDFSTTMLEQAGAFLKKEIHLVACDFHSLPFASHSFDFATGSFILRSVQNRAHFFEEIARILEPGGKVAFLELTRPRNRLVWECVYKPYLRFYVPSVGKLFSRHEHAYEFLSQSVQSFVEPDLLSRELAAAGFHQVSIETFSLGIAALIQAKIKTP